MWNFTTFLFLKLRCTQQAKARKSQTDRAGKNACSVRLLSVLVIETARVKFRIAHIKVVAVKFVLHHAQTFTETGRLK